MKICPYIDRLKSDVCDALVRSATLLRLFCAAYWQMSVCAMITLRCKFDF